MMRLSPFVHGLNFIFSVLSIVYADPSSLTNRTSKGNRESGFVILEPNRLRRPHALFAWGRNNVGQLGLGHTNQVNSPQILSTFAAKEIKRIASGGGYEDPLYEGFSLVVSAAGNLFSFGSNTHGQLGVGDRLDRTSLVPVSFLLTGKVSQVTAGRGFSVVVTDSGQVFTWGSNAHGQLGLGDLKDRLAPELVKGVLVGVEVSVVAAGMEHVVVMSSLGELYTWGSNARSQLGVGKQTVRQSSPLRLQGAITGIKFVWVATGGQHTLAVSKSGEVYCWGNNDFGQLGLGDLEERATPHAILHKFTRSKITRAAAGNHHSMALTEGGDLFTWGGNQCGQLGYENKGGRKFVGYPKRVETIRAARIKASAMNSLAVLPTGKVFVWGCSHNGELGFGDVAARTTPHILPTPGGQSFADMAPGAHHVLAVSRKGELYGWGRNTVGQLGLAYTTRAELKPVLIASGTSTDVTLVATGGYAYEYQGHTAAVTASGKVYTWGWNAFGQLGLGSLDAGTPTPTRLFALEQPYTITSLALGQYNSVFSTDRKKVAHTFTWGPNYNGQLGHKFLELGPITEPSKIESLKGRRLIQVEMGYSHVVALGEDGTVFTWGNNAHGQLGTGDSKERTKPTPLTVFRSAQTDSPVHTVAAGQQSSYAVTSQGRVFAWGYNANFELGLGEGTNRNSPQGVRSLDKQNITSIAAGGYHVLAVGGSGEVFAWGGNEFGQLGLGHRSVVKQPERIKSLPPALNVGGGVGAGIAGLAAGTWHSAVVTQGGRLWTWGRGDFGQLGHPLQEGVNDIDTPREVERLSDCAVGGVVAGAAHTMVTAVPGKSWEI